MSMPREKRLSRQRAARKWLYWDRREAGQCVDCGDEADGKVRCPPCALRQLRVRRFTRKDVAPDRRGIRKNPAHA